MVKSKIVLSQPGDYTSSFYEKLRSNISKLDKTIDISINDIVSLQETFYDLITNAKKTIDIMAPFQTNIDGILLSKIRNAIDDGINVRILTRFCNEENACFNNRWISNYVRHFDHVENSKKTGSIHAKVVIRDGEEVYFGSGELMETSLNKNLEIGFLTDDNKIVKIIDTIFESAWELAK